MFLRALAALLLILAATPVLAQSDDDLPGPPECLDVNDANRCDPEVQARVRALLGMASIEAEAASGAIVYRAFFVDGYDRDMPAVAFERRPGQSPEVVVYGEEGRSTRAPVDYETWERVVRDAEYADRVLVPLSESSGADPDEESVVICVHSWVQTVEVANGPRERFVEEPVRRRTESACDGALTTRYAFLLADLAVEQIPWCRRIDADTERNSVTRLATCLMLSGDRLMAADLYNERLADSHWMRGDDLSASDIRAQLALDREFVLLWDGQEVRNGDWRDNPVGTFLRARIAEFAYLRFWPVDIEATSPHRVLVRGIATAAADDQRVTADYSQTWVWDPYGLRWSLSAMTVGPFAPVPDPED